MAIDATVGGATANSYLTEAAFRDYASGTPSAALVADASSTAVEIALRSATRWLDTYAYLGEETAPATQRLAWPRRSVPDPDRVLFFYPDTVLPRRLTEACAEVALVYLAEPGTDPFGLLPAAVVVREKVGPIETEYAGATGSISPRIRAGLERVPHVRRMLQPLFRDSALQGTVTRA